MLSGNGRAWSYGALGSWLEEGRHWEHAHLGGDVAVGETVLLITNKRLLFLMNRLNFPPPTWFRLLLSRNGAVPRLRGWGAGETPTPGFPASQEENLGVWGSN